MNLGLELSGAVRSALGEEAWAEMFAPDGLARHTMWQCQDGWCVGYTTERIRHGRNDGKFAAFAYKPIGKGARSDPKEWKRVYFQTYSKRKTARKRAETLWERHSN